MPRHLYNTAQISEQPGSASEGDLPIRKSTYGQILRSTAMVGGASVLTLGISVVRTKAMAMLLTPAQFGLTGLYLSIVYLAQSLAGMGIQSSGVRQIADAAKSGDNARITRTAAVLRRLSLVLGLTGGGLVILFARPISWVTFDSDKKTSAVFLLSAAVCFNLVSGGQGALIQGMRRISDLAQMSVVGSLCGTLASLPVVYFFRERGLVASIVATAAIAVLTSWWYSRKITFQTVSLTLPEVRRETTALLRLGFAFMSSGFVMMASAYIIRVTVLHKLGLEATGLYQSAWTLGGLYVGMILDAMGADFYPRLTAQADDNPECNRLVNEQARISLLLAGGGVLGTLTFAPVVISTFYAAHFAGAVGVLRWLCLGIALRVISWPMGFIIMAKGRQGMIIFCELAWMVVHLGLAWICIGRYGLNGAGIAFFGSYVFHVFLTYAIVRRLSGFRWSPENVQLCSFYVIAIAVVFCGFSVLRSNLAVCLGAVVAVISTIYSSRTLLRLFPLARIPKLLRPVLSLGAL